DEAFHELNEVNGNGRAVAKQGDLPAQPEFTVVRTEKFHAQPMSVSDAIVQLNLLHEPFLVFRSDTDGRVAVVYKREDGSYGLIETPTAAS
ncbi:MAG TPA: sigma 54 modulation/S30EA ribosomal C-terminal domain-containing protein, partial [Kofleriaceae bacterium]|nr:sigma 54 modulation/S30EA ribosomal C-terminal domain-containing protein [Kofleriaceae bacterium]